MLATVPWGGGGESRSLSNITRHFYPVPGNTRIPPDASAPPPHCRLVSVGEAGSFGDIGLSGDPKL
jgi:hypothetical protein